MRVIRFLFSIVMALTLGAALHQLLASGSTPSLADSGVHYVAPGGECAGAVPCYMTIQAAVDAAAAGDEIRIAAGTYSDVDERGGTYQAVLIDHNLTLRGGYTVTNWTTPNPAAYTTTIDAGGLGRGMVIRDASATIEGLQITNGHDSDYGGGIYVENARAIISQCVVISNTAASYGGGIGISRSDITITESSLAQNRSYYGGGVSSVGVGPISIVLRHNRIQANSAEYGGGLHLLGGHAILSDNVIGGNQARFGGGLSLSSSTAVSLTRNRIEQNRAGMWGGGLVLESSRVTFEKNQIRDNSAGEWGGGIALQLDRYASLIGDTVQNNEAGTYGGGLYLSYSTVEFNNGSILDNKAQSGGGAYLDSSRLTLSGVRVQGNVADEQGGGLHLYSSSANLNNVWIRNNHAGEGGGVLAEDSRFTLERSRVTGNQAGSGGGVFLEGGPASLVNALVSRNVLTDPAGMGAGLYAIYSPSRSRSVSLVHATVADNHGGGGEGLYLAEGATAALTNTILAGHKVGIAVDRSSRAMLEGMLWYNVTNIMGEGSITFGAINLYRAPLFIGNGNYHLASLSPAIDAGVDAGITTDLDGDPRPLGQGYDIGSDESPFSLKHYYLPLAGH